MDRAIKERLEKYYAQIEEAKAAEFRLEAAEREVANLEAHEDTLFSQMLNKTPDLDKDGKKRSNVEREHEVEASPEWLDFKLGLVEAKSSRNRAKIERDYAKELISLKRDAWQSEYLSFKIDSDAIKRAG